MEGHVAEVPFHYHSRSGRWTIHSPIPTTWEEWSTTFVVARGEEPHRYSDAEDDAIDIGKARVCSWVEEKLTGQVPQVWKG